MSNSVLKVHDIRYEMLLLKIIVSLNMQIELSYSLKYSMALIVYIGLTTRSSEVR